MHNLLKSQKKAEQGNFTILRRRYAINLFNIVETFISEVINELCRIWVLGYVFGRWSKWVVKPWMTVNTMVKLIPLINCFIVRLICDNQQSLHVTDQSLRKYWLENLSFTAMKLPYIR